MAITFFKITVMYYTVEELQNSQFIIYAVTMVKMTLNCTKNKTVKSYPFLTTAVWFVVSFNLSEEGNSVSETLCSVTYRHW